MAIHVGLPRAVGALYELAVLPPEVLDGALAEGVIHPNMERREARRLRPHHSAADTGDGPGGIAARSDRIDSEWFDAQGQWIPLMFTFSLEVIQGVAKTIRTFTDEATLRIFAGDDEIAEDLVIAAQNFLLALDLGWKRTHAVNGVHCGVKIGREGLLGLVQPGGGDSECPAA